MNARSPSFSLIARIVCVSLVAGWMAACGDDSAPEEGTSGGASGSSSSGGHTNAGSSNTGDAGAEASGPTSGAGGAGGGEALAPLGDGGASESTSVGSGGQNEPGSPGDIGEAGAGGQPSAGHGGAPSATGGSAGSTGSAGNVGNAARLPCDVAAILRAECQECHTDPPTNGAPFALLTYSQAQSVALEIKAALLADLMPLDGPPLSQSEKNTIIDWIDSGAPASTASCP